jgi:hypothetical protein
MNPNLEQLARETRNPDVKLEDRFDKAENAEILVFSTIDGLYVFSDGFWLNILPKQEDSLLKLVAHESDLYGIFSSGIKHLQSRTVITLRDAVEACSLNGEMYDSGSYGIMKTVENKRIVAKSITDLCVHNNQILYTVHGRAEMFTYPDTGVYQIRRGNLKPFHSYDNKLYAVRTDNEEDAIFDEDGNEVGRLPDGGDIKDFAFCNGSLFIVGDDSIYDLSEDKIYDFKYEVANLTDFISVPKRLIKGAGLLK